jgi:starch-binding outer membrane protein, SusD/RagB family
MVYLIFTKMKMKTYIKLLVSVIVTLTLISSCDKSFLDEKVLNAYAPSTLNDQLGYEASAVGLYNHFSTFWLYAGDNQTQLNMFYLGTDITWNPQSKTTGSARSFHDYTTLTASNQAVQRLWTYLYKLINNANVIIYNAENNAPSSMTKAQIDAYDGEAKFFRAYAYNMLATLYGDVPLVTDPVYSAKTDFVRETVSEVNKLIISDLLFAAAKLSDIDATKEARANKSMARQLLSEVYLRANQPALAEKQCDSIINSGKLSLIKNRYGNTTVAGDAFSDMFRLGKMRRSQGNTELIWALEVENPTDVAYTIVDYPQQRRNWQACYHNISGMKICDSIGGRGLGRMRLDSWVLYGLYGAGDMRNSKYSIHRRFSFNDPQAKYAAIYGKPVPYGKDTIIALGGSYGTVKIAALDTIANITPYTTKYGHFDSRDEFGYGMWKDIIFMRLGETYLLRAEARFKQSNTSGAADDINVLRSRAQAASVSASDITLDFILDERARELIGEENRRMTLVRTGTLVDRAKRLCGTTTLANGNIETTNGITNINLLLPIPQNERDLNKDADLTQNTGY